MQKFILNLIMAAIFLSAGIFIGLYTFYNSKTAKAEVATGDAEYNLTIDDTYRNYEPDSSPEGARYCALREVRNLNNPETPNNPVESCNTDDPWTNAYRMRQDRWNVTYTLNGVTLTEIWEFKRGNPVTSESWAWLVTITGPDGLSITEKWLAVEFYANKGSAQGPTRGIDHAVYVIDGKNNDVGGYINLPSYNPNNYADGGVRLYPPAGQTELDYANPENNILKWHVRWQSEANWCNPNSNNNYWYHGWLGYKEDAPLNCNKQQDRLNGLFNTQYYYMVPKTWKVKVEGNI